MGNSLGLDLVTEADVVGCPDCGTLQTVPPLQAREVFLCCVCDIELERKTGRNLDVALAFSLATVLFLLAANALPILTASALGARRQSYLISGVGSMWSLDWPSLAVAIALVIIVLPLIRFGLLTFVLASLKLGWRPPILGRLFLVSSWLKMWAMPDVLLLALWVAYARLSATVDTMLEPGAYFLIAAGLCALLTRATLDRQDVWRALPISGPIVAEPCAVGSLGGVPEMACHSCELVLPRSYVGRPCPRCGSRVRTRVRGSVEIAIALTAAGVLLYIPANLYAMATIPIGLHPTSYNVLGGVIDLLDAHLLGLALLVFTASFAIPFCKLAGLSWCLLSVVTRSKRFLRTKTRVYRVIEEIGRWSMVDPLVIALFVPVTRFNTVISSSAGPAAPFFTAVVVLTMISANLFDPRLMWDAARKKL